jgi:hypothetical protein
LLSKYINKIYYVLRRRTDLVDCCVGVDCCVFVTNLLFSPGKYQHIAMEFEGACGPIMIHCDATQTEEKKPQERERQCNGETPTETNVTHKFLQGVDLPEVLVRTSKSGSMTQEIFYVYCKQFVTSLCFYK